MRFFKENTREQDVFSFLCDKSPKVRSELIRQSLLDIFWTEIVGYQKYYHIDTVADMLAAMPVNRIDNVFSIINYLATSISHLLAFDFIDNVYEAMELLDNEQLNDWVREAVSIYEAEGLVPAQKYLNSVHETAIKFTSRERVATCEDAQKKLKLLMAALTDKEIEIKNSEQIFTDSHTIYAPRVFAKFPDYNANFLFYKCLTVHKCAQIRYDSFILPLMQTKEIIRNLCNFNEISESENLSGFELVFMPFPQWENAFYVFSLIDTIRIENFIKNEFSGLNRDFKNLKIILEKYAKDELFGKFGVLARLIKWVLSHYPPETPLIQDNLNEKILSLTKPDATPLNTAKVFIEIYKNLTDNEKIWDFSSLIPYIGSVNPFNVSRQLMKKRNDLRQNFIEALATLILEREKITSEKNDIISGQKESAFLNFDDHQKGTAILMSKYQDKEANDIESLINSFITIDGINQDKIEELKCFKHEIECDFGNTPNSYITGAFGLAGSGWTCHLVSPESSEAESKTIVKTVYLYDEWDFRRSAYKKEWCSLRELEVSMAKGDFYEKTLINYRGLLINLKKQFEILRPEYTLSKRQKDGDDVDIDSFVENLSEYNITGSFSENLYIKYLKKERNIAVAFLVDMSASTEGWVNKLIKESLILLCESMQSLGDRYAIYGFSGMRRTECHFFRIKDIEEKYNEDVKSRICGITSRDYTRMGPAISHVINIFKDIQSRLKIMIVLSDGKPEDYDDYKGVYAIEDSKKALIEAKLSGIKPFCITIDKEARDYLPHLFGDVNYILVNNIFMLPKRITEIYRLLTK